VHGSKGQRCKAGNGKQNIKNGRTLNQQPQRFCLHSTAHCSFGHGRKQIAMFFDKKGLIIYHLRHIFAWTVLEPPQPKKHQMLETLFSSK
jgi:hypothetical protein